MKLFASLAAVVLMWMFSCNMTPPERTAYETVVASKAFIDKEKAAHPECNSQVQAAVVTTAGVCVNLAKATGAKDVLIDVVEALCAGPNFNTGGACDFPKKGTPAYDQAVSKVNAAISSYNQAANDLKAATGGK
jgi:hypothetical protein